MEFHSGAIIETHDLVPYQSLGAIRGLTLTYDSERADSRPILHFGYDNTVNDTAMRLMARLTFRRGGFTQQVPGYTGGQFGLTGGEHFWTLPGGNVDAALQGDLRAQPSGRYDYELDTGLVRFNGQVLSGTLFPQQGEVIHVNSIGSPFGNGWGLAGLQEIVENPDGSVLVIDGDSSELLFEAPGAPGAPYVSPPGDFSTLEKLGNGTFRRTMKDQTVCTFNAQNRLETMRDRNGNETRYAYDGAGVLTRITDPVGLETTFTSTSGRITAITDPAGRTTRLDYDAAGNLTRVTDPDQATRTWEYDNARHMIAETDQRGNREQTLYSFSGRAIGGVRKDDSVLHFMPVQIQGLYAADATIDPQAAPPAFPRITGTAVYDDGNGNVTRSILDQAGQEISSSDAVGALPTTKRDSQNLVTQVTDARGHQTLFTYSPGRSLQFDGGTDFVAVGDRLDMGTSDFTLEAWIKGDAGMESFARIIDKGYFTGYAFGRVGATRRVGFEFLNSGSQGNNFGTTSDVIDGTWHHVAVVKIGTLVKIYADGVEENSETVGSAAQSNDRDLYLGANNGEGGAGHWRGQLDEVRIWTVARTSAQIRASLHQPLMGSESGLAAYWRLDEGSGDTAFDSTASGNNGRLGAGVANQQPARVEDSFPHGKGNLLSMRDELSRGGGTFIEGGGQIVIEAEHFSTRGGSPATWRVVPDEDPGFNPAINNRGTSLLQLLPETGSFNGTPLSSSAPFVDYKLRIATPGSYQLYTRIAGFDGGSDSLYAGILELADGQGGTNADYYQFNPRSNDFANPGWIGIGGREATFFDPFLEPARFTIATPGDYTLRVSQREDGTEIDALILQLASLTAPTGAGPAESVRVNVVDGPGERRFTYDDTFSQLTSMTDELGRQTLMEVDPANGNVLSLIQVVGAVGGADDVITRMTYTSQGLIASMTDPNGHVTRFDYNARGLPITLTEAAGTPDQGIMRFEYDAAGNMSAMIDENVNRTEFVYDDLNRLTRMTEDDPDDTGPLTSPITRMDYDPAGNLITITDARNHVTQLTYDPLHRLASTTDARNGVSRFAYDGAGNLVSAKDELGRETRFRYDARNRLIETIDALGGRALMQYDADNNPIAMTDENSHATRLAYDARNRIVRMTDALGKSMTYDYDPADQLRGMTDRNGHSTQYAYDDVSRLTSQTDARNGVMAYEYDLDGKVVAMTDELNRRTQMAYDARDRRTSVTSPLGNTMRWTYDATGNVTSASDGLNQTTRYAYDALNRLSQQTDALNGVIKYVYDSVDNLVAMTDELNRTWQNVYDELNRPTTMTDPLGHTNQMAYDAVDNLTSYTDGVGQVTRYDYDALDRQTRMTDARGGITAFTYDAIGNLLSLTDPVNNTTRFAYDELDRLKTETNPLNAVRTYGYDAVGNLVRVTDRNGRVRRFTYDELDRQTKEEWLDAGSNAIRTFNFTFDGASQLNTAADPDSAYAYAYDLDSRLTAVSNAGTPGVSTVVLGYTYDAADNLRTRTDTIAGTPQGTNAYSYDALNRMERITQSGNGVTDKRVDMGYDAASQMKSVTRFADLTGTQLVASSVYTYDNAARLDGLTHARGSTTLAAYAWEYDAADRITLATSPDGTSVYSYDTTNQLTGADHSFQADEGYNYDLNGNRTNAGFQTDPDNRLKSDGTFMYEYDREGNRTRRINIVTGEVTEYQWDYRNRLTQVVTKDSVGQVTMRANYTYDPFNRRIAKVVDADADGPATPLTDRFLYDGLHIALQFDGAGTQTHRFLHGPAIDQIFADETTLGTILWRLTDNQGTVRDLVDSAGAVQNHIKYDSFGRITAEMTAAADFLFAYTGREFDVETGLYYYRARYYDAIPGRFLSEDPITFRGGDGNLYRYTRNSPANRSDPLGLEANGTSATSAGPTGVLGPAGPIGPPTSAEYSPPITPTASGPGVTGVSDPATPWVPPVSDKELDRSYTVPVIGPWTRDETIGLLQGLSDPIWGLTRLCPGTDGSFSSAVDAGVKWFGLGEARIISEEYAKQYGMTAGETNALQHVMWQAILTYKYGAADAEAVGNKHESEQSHGNALRQRDREADLRNNAIGREIGELVSKSDFLRYDPAGPVGAMKRLIKDYFEHGKLDLGGGQGGGFGIGPGGGKGLIHKK